MTPEQRTEQQSQGPDIQEKSFSRDGVVEQDVQSIEDEGDAIKDESIADHGQKIDDTAEVESSADSSSDELTKCLMDAEKKVEEHWNGILRLQAEMENLRRRSAREVENAHKYGLDRFISELLPVKDSLELGVAAANSENAEVGAIREGMELTLKMFGTAIEKFGVEEVSPSRGENFDHGRHQAMSVQEDKEAESGTILMVIQKGCLLNGRLVRPAMVIVAK